MYKSIISSISERNSGVDIPLTLTDEHLVVLRDFLFSMGYAKQLHPEKNIIGWLHTKIAWQREIFEQSNASGLTLQIISENGVTQDCKIYEDTYNHVLHSSQICGARGERSKSRLYGEVCVWVKPEVLLFWRKLPTHKAVFFQYPVSVQRLYEFLSI